MLSWIVINSLINPILLSMKCKFTLLDLRCSKATCDRSVITYVWDVDGWQRPNVVVPQYLIGIYCSNQISDKIVRISNN